jgi:hypothetical protein
MNNLLVERSKNQPVASKKDTNSEKNISNRVAQEDKREG